jgi:hypothetical protein
MNSLIVVPHPVPNTTTDETPKPYASWAGLCPQVKALALHFLEMNPSLAVKPVMKSISLAGK